jgi:hypothetical protein
VPPSDPSPWREVLRPFLWRPARAINAKQTSDAPLTEMADAASAPVIAGCHPKSQLCVAKKYLQSPRFVAKYGERIH